MVQEEDNGTNTIKYYFNFLVGSTMSFQYARRIHGTVGGRMIWSTVAVPSVSTKYQEPFTWSVDTRISFK
jgi:hypothetical protein